MQDSAQLRPLRRGPQRVGEAAGRLDEPAETDAVDAPAAADEDAAEAVSEEPQGDGIKSPKTMSGMSILGNEEAPKSLVIIPWKSSRMGDELSLSDTLDDRAQPVDKEVFLR